MVHHDHLKLHYVPTGPRNVFCPVRERGDFTFVDHGLLPPVIAPGSAGPPVGFPSPPNPRVRPARLRPNVRPKCAAQPGLTIMSLKTFSQ